VTTPISEHTIHRRVQFYETDAAGIVHFSWYTRYMEEAEHALWREAGMSIASPDAAVGWPRVAIGFEFYRPLRFEEEFTVTIRVTGIGERRIEYRCLLARGEVRLALGTMTIACIAKSGDGAMKSTPVPGSVAERLRVSDAPAWEAR
jgi:YbgC/YbaW family acyl-CoA thioester hydrolase